MTENNTNAESIIIALNSFYMSLINECDSESFKEALEEQRWGSIKLIRKYEKKAQAFDDIKYFAQGSIRNLQVEQPRTNEHLIAIGTFQTVLNRAKELESGDE